MNAFAEAFKDKFVAQLRDSSNDTNVKQPQQQQGVIDEDCVVVDDPQLLEELQDVYVQWLAVLTYQPAKTKSEAGEVKREEQTAQDDEQIVSSASSPAKTEPPNEEDAEVPSTGRHRLPRPAPSFTAVHLAPHHLFNGFPLEGLMSARGDTGPNPHAHGGGGAGSSKDEERDMIWSLSSSPVYACLAQQAAAAAGWASRLLTTLALLCNGPAVDSEDGAVVPHDRDTVMLYRMWAELLLYYLSPYGRWAAPREGDQARAAVVQFHRACVVALALEAATDPPADREEEAFDVDTWEVLLYEGLAAPKPVEQRDATPGEKGEGPYLRMILRSFFYELQLVAVQGDCNSFRTQQLPKWVVRRTVEYLQEAVLYALLLVQSRAVRHLSEAHAARGQPQHTTTAEEVGLHVGVLHAVSLTSPMQTQTKQPVKRARATAAPRDEGEGGKREGLPTAAPQRGKGRPRKRQPPPKAKKKKAAYWGDSSSSSSWEEEEEGEEGEEGWDEDLAELLVGQAEWEQDEGTRDNAVASHARQAGPRRRAGPRDGVSVEALLEQHTIPFHVELADVVLTTYQTNTSWPAAGSPPLSTDSRQGQVLPTVGAEHYARSGALAWLSLGESKRHESLIQEKK